MISTVLALAVLTAEPLSVALIVGVNTPLDPNVAPLRYADDDAARSQELFEALGVQTFVLARLDENTARLHPGVAAQSTLPRRASWVATLDALEAVMAAARAQQRPTTLFFVYAGHANTQGDSGYLTLEDARLTPADLRQLIDRARPDVTHLIVDACRSSFLAYGRGPGGVRTQVHGFAGTLAAMPNVGLLLSTGSGRESHEWEGFQAGVFSHEVRSGLIGAADADNDGTITYREIASFVARANGAIANEKYRPDLLALPPTTAHDLLLPKPPASSPRIELAGRLADHYLLEDSRGVRVADFHNDLTMSLRLVRPRHGGSLYLRTSNGLREYRLPDQPVVEVGALASSRVQVAARGAASDAFALAFSLPFDSSVAASWRPPSLEVAAPRSTTLVTGWSLIAAGGLAAAASATAFIVARSNSTASPRTQFEASEVNRRIETSNLIGVVAGGVGLGALSAGIALLLWPDSPVTPGVSGEGVQVSGRF